MFEYLATFSNAREWDPVVMEGGEVRAGRPEWGRCTGSPSGPPAGSCRWTTSRRLDRPHRVVLQARRGGLLSSDTITVEPLSRGLVCTTSPCSTRAASSVVAPLVGVRSAKMADRAAAGLRLALA